MNLGQVQDPEAYTLVNERVKSMTNGKVSSQSCTICLLKKEPNRSSTCGGGVSLFYELN